VTPPALERALSEKDWQRQVTDLMDWHGWTWKHDRRVRVQRPNGSFYFETATDGPGGPGFPDITAWRERVIYVELKRQGGRLSDEQVNAHRTLENAGAEVYVWRPGDFDIVFNVLQTRRPALGPN